MPKPTKPSKKIESSTDKDTPHPSSSGRTEEDTPYSRTVKRIVSASKTGKMPTPVRVGGEKQTKVSVSKKKASKSTKKDSKSTEKPKKEKSPQGKNRPTSVKKDVGSVDKEKGASAQREGTQSKKKRPKIKSLGRKKATERVPKKQEKDEDSKNKNSKKEGGDKNSKKKSTSKGKTRSRSRSKSHGTEENGTPKLSTPTKSNKSTPSKVPSSGSSKSPREKELLSSGKMTRHVSVHGQVKKGKKATSVPPAKKKIAASKVKESSSNIESSSSIDLSAEQKKMSSSPSGRRRTAEVKDIQGQGPDSQRISKEVEEVIKRIEDKKKIKKTGKLMEKKRKRGDSQALVETHTAKDFDYILQRNPNVKSKPYINLEDLSKHHLIYYSDILLSLLEVGQNADSYLFPYSSKSKCFWSDILEYKVLKKIFVDFKAETLRKYWSELSKYDTEDTTDLIKKNKAYLDNLPLKLGTIVSSISKLLSGQIKDLREYIDTIQVDIRKKEIFEHEFKDPKTGEITKVKEVRTTYRKRYEPGNLKDFKGSTMNVVSLKEVYHQNSNLSDFQKVMKDIKKEDSAKFSYLNEKTEEDKKKLNTINEDDKFVFKAIDNVLDSLSSEFKNYSTDYILDTLQQNSMDISKTYTCLKDPSKRKTIGFTPLDDKVLLRKQGEEYKILLKEKGKDAIQEREEFLSH